MKKINIEKSIKRAINEAPKVDFEKLASMPVVKMSEHDYITKQQEKQSPKYHKQFSAAYASCLIGIVCFSGWFTQYKIPDSVIELDVNPSIELVTNKQDHILSVKALNEDAQKVIEGQNFINADLNETVDAILGSMINQGYLNKEKNIIMVSVENKNMRKADELTVMLDDAIENSVSLQDISPQVLRQVFSKNEEDSALAEQYDVSVGKINLINEILSSNKKPSVSMDEITNMSMGELISISKEREIDLHKIIQFDDDYSSDDKHKDDADKKDDAGNNNKLENNNDAYGKNDESKALNASDKKGDEYKAISTDNKKDDKSKTINSSDEKDDESIINDEHEKDDESKVINNEIEDEDENENNDESKAINAPNKKDVKDDSNDKKGNMSVMEWVTSMITNNR